MFQGQDFEPVILRKPKKAEPNLVPQISHEQKYKKQLEAEEAKLNILKPEIRQTMIAFRNEKNLTQSQLSKMINEQSSVIRDLESGKVVNSRGVLQKINKILGTKLSWSS